MARDGASSSRRSNFTEPPPMKLSERLEYKLPCTREIFRALQDENINLISINCGQNKRGDTITTKEFMERVKQQGIFEEVVMTVVSLDPNLRRIQDEIADNLQVKLGNGNLFERAKVLRARMSRDSRRLLLVFLDVREMLDLEAIGIPYGSPNGKCKIIFMLGLLDESSVTMRAQSSFHLSGDKKSLPIGILPEQEAWSLFREMAGSSIESPELRPVAQQVLSECAGLPIAIATVGRALQHKSKQTWEDALNQLRKPCPENIPGMVQEAYRKIELSYECLGSEEAKSLFLFCCIYPESSDVLVHDLVKFGVGLQLFKNIDSKREAGKCVETLIEILKSSFMLLESDKEGCVKMHDIVHKDLRNLRDCPGVVRHASRAFVAGVSEPLENVASPLQAELLAARKAVVVVQELYPSGVDVIFEGDSSITLAAVQLCEEDCSLLEPIINDVCTYLLAFTQPKLNLVRG